MCANQKMQEMDEQRIRQLAAGYCHFSDIEKNVMPIISKCLEGITEAGKKINEKQVEDCCLECSVNVLKIKKSFPYVPAYREHLNVRHTHSFLKETNIFTYISGTVL